MKSLIKLLSLLLFMGFITGCGEIVSSLDQSSVKGFDLSFDSLPDISASNIITYPVSGRCVPQYNDVTISVGIPVLVSQNFACLNGIFGGAVDLSSAGLPEGLTSIVANQALLTANASIQVLKDTIIPSTPVILNPLNGASFNSVSITISGTCETGTTVNLFGDLVGSPLTVACVAATFTSPAALVLGNGAKSISATQTDGVGNTSLADVISVNLGILPLVPVISTPADGLLTQVVSQTVSGTCEAGATVNVFGDVVGAPVTTPCVAGSYSLGVTLTAINGVKTINVSQTNGAGTSPTASITNTLYNTAPSAPTITTPTNGAITNSTAQTVTGACETGATVNLSGDFTGSPVTASCVASAYSRAINLTASQGSKAISANQTDPAGNTSSATNISLTLDSLAPSAPTIVTPTNGVTTNTTAQTVTGACETGATVNLSGAFTGSPVTAACVASAYSRAITLTAAQGSKAISATQTDAGGNTSSATNISLTLDTLTPSAPTITTPANGSFTNSTAQTVTGVCETGATVNLSGDFTGSPVTASCVASAYSRAITLTAAQGSKAISATQTDAGGNTSSATNISLTLDTLTPSAPTIVTPTNSAIVNTTAQTVTGACETGATVNLSGDFTGSPVAASCVASAYSRAITLTAAQGSKAINATQTDLALNTSSSTNISITLDTGAPSAPTITTPANGSFTNSTAQTVTGACETGATVNLSGDFTGSPVTASCVASTYSQAITLTASQGSKAIGATQTDTGGNTSSATNISLTLDTLTPSAPTIVTPANGATTNATAQTVTGACETGATVNLSGDFTGSPVTASCVASAYSRAITLTAAQGSKAISATQTDPAGNTSAATNISLTLDSLAPSAPTIVTPTSGATTNSTAQTVTGACETGATVNLSGAFTGSPVTAACVASAYSRAITLTAAQGSKAITATQTDPAGNTSSATNISLTLDTLAPSAPTITTPANGSFTNSTAQTVTGACETGATVNLSGDFTGSPVTAACVASAYSRAITLTAAQGSKAISATQTDPAGNTSAATNISLTLDTLSPSAPTIVTPSNGSVTSNTSPVVTGACETGAIVSISGDIVASPQTTTCVASAYSRLVVLSASDGLKSLTAIQTDPAGNVSASTNISFTLDTGVPAAPSIITPVSGSFTNTTAQTVTGACETGATVNLSGAFTGSPVTAACVASSYSRAITLTAAQGSKAISATQTDPAGNTSSATNTTITFDSVAPSAPTIATPTNGSTTNSTAQTVTGACETGATVNLSGDFTGSPVTASCVASVYSRAITLTAAQGSKAISATQTDQAGNTSSATNISLTLDTLVPSAPTIVTPTNGATTNSTAQTVTGACETGATVNLSGDFTGSPLTAACVASAYSRAITLTASQGSKAISATQTDPAGNTSAATNISITLDSVAPSAPTITTPANGSFTNSTAQTVTGVCETGATVNLSGDFTGSPVTAACVASAYSRAITLTAAQGSKAISATQTDPAGNTSSATNISLTLDTLAPSNPTITAPVNNSTVSSASQTVTGACETGATVNISGDLVGSPLTATCIAAAYSRAVTLTASFGVKAINVSQTDPASNTSGSVGISVNYTNLNVTYPATFTGPKYTQLNDPSAGIAPTVVAGTPTSYSISPALPTGLTINAVSGLISGIPTVSDVVGQNYTITISDGIGTIQRVMFLRISIPDYTWMGTAGDGLWTTASNWRINAVPPTSAWVYFDNECLASGNCNANINSNTQIRRLFMKSTYTGTITQNPGVTFQVGSRVSNNTNRLIWGKWEMEAGTFVGGNSNLTVDRINIQGGTFTSTSGTLLLGSNHGSTPCGGSLPSWDNKGVLECGFTLSATATFNHNNGIFHVNSGVTTHSVRVFAFWLDQQLNLANLIFENFTNSNTDSFGRQNTAESFIYGLNKTINVTTTLDWRDGWLDFGTINFQGLNAIFRCDAITNSDNCSDLDPRQDRDEEPGGVTRVGILVSTFIRFNRNDGTPQTYTFDDGAAAPGFIIDNPNGVSPIATNPTVGYFRISRIRLDQGVFTAPKHLSFGEGTNTLYSSNAVGIFMNGGGFNHNGGLVSIDSVTQFDDNREAMVIEAPSGINFFDFELNIAGDFDVNGPTDNYTLRIPPNTILNIEGDLSIRNGKFSGPGVGNLSYINLYGNLNLFCLNFAAKDCYGESGQRIITTLLGPDDSTIFVESGGSGFYGTTNFIINKTLSTNRVTLISNFGTDPTNANSPILRVTNGILDLGSFDIFHPHNFINNGIVQCNTGVGYLQYTGTFSGTPQPGNNPLCYGP